MSTTPPEQPRTAGAARGGDDEHLPLGLGMVPGNAELIVYVLALLVAMLVCWIADNLDSSSWLNFFLWTTAAYLLSRGIAKASRVYEL